MIRKATRFDLPECVEIMRQYAAESPMLALSNPAAHDAAHVESLLMAMIAGRGFVLLDDQHRGMLAAIIIKNVWCPSVVVVQELAWWVAPEHRGGTVGGKLFAAFKREADSLVKAGRAQVICASLIHDGLTLKGFHKLETTYCKE